MNINIFSKEFWSGKTSQEVRPTTEEPNQAPNMTYNAGVGSYGAVYAIYDGETNMGEMGPAKVYLKDFYTLRIRSKQMFIDSEVCQMIITRNTQWVIGDGLTMESEPQAGVLKMSGIELDTEDFNNDFEEAWKVYAQSRIADYTGKWSLRMLQAQAHMECKLGGDMLVILRVVNGLVRVQHIDGAHVGNPPNVGIDYKNKTIAGYQGNQGFDFIYPPTGNRVRYGVEINVNGEAVAYHVRVGMGLEYDRVKARDSKGFLRAYMIYGFKPELDATRGTPLLTIVMQNAANLTRYLSAVVTSAEERAKFPFFFEHGSTSMEDDPLAGRRAKAYIAMPPNGPTSGAMATDIAIDSLGNQIANDVAVSMNKTVVNLPRDVKAVSLESKTELHVKEFTTFMIDIICAAVGIPPNVAMSKYEDSFSASRMAGKDWEHTFMTEREWFSQQYLNPIHDLQMYVWVLENKLQAPGYINALAANNELAVAAYNHCRWNGDMFPDIDPLKTANYLKVMTGVGGEYMPLMTNETAAKIMGQGEYAAILKQVSDERKKAAGLGIKEAEPRGENIEGFKGGPGQGSQAGGPDTGKVKE